MASSDDSDASMNPMEQLLDLGSKLDLSKHTARIRAMLTPREVEVLDTRFGSDGPPEEQVTPERVREVLDESLAKLKTWKADP